MLACLLELLFNLLELKGVYNFVMVDGGDQLMGQGLDLIKVKVWLTVQDVEGKLGSSVAAAWLTVSQLTQATTFFPAMAI